MLKRKWLRPLTMVAALGVAAAACGGGGGNTGGGGGGQAGGGQGGGDDKVLKLGYVLPETGQLAFLGPPQIQATKYAISQINDAGGVLGNEVPDVVAGDGANPDMQVANNSTDRVLNAGVDAIMGAASSATSLSIIDKITGAQVVQCSAANTSREFTDYDDGGYYFRTAPSDALQGPVLAETIVGDGHANVAVVARADDYGRGLANATANALKEIGATVSLKTTYDPKAQTFDATVQEIQNAQPDAVALIAFDEGAQILKGMIEAGMGPDSVGIYGADGLRSEELPELVSKSNPEVLAGMKGTAPASVSPDFSPQLKEFAPDLEEVQFAPQAFDCVTTVALAAQAAESTDPTVFVKEMVGVTKDGQQCSSFEECKGILDNGGNIDYQGASGPLEFTQAGEPSEARYAVYTFNEEGDLVVDDRVLSELPNQ